MKGLEAGARVSPAHAASYMGVPPIKAPSWKPGMIPGYFWLGGIAAGAWLVVSLDDLAGERDEELLRAGRWVAAGALGGGTVLLITDLGRPERFLNMLRVARPRSAMNAGAWGLTAFGGAVGLALLVQVLRDLGGAGRGANAAALDRGIQLLGLAPGLFVGSYTGVLLSSTSVPAWALRSGWLGPLFAAASTSSGIGTLLVIGELRPWRSSSTARRLARAQAAALAIELALSHVSERPAARLPSRSTEPRDERALRALAHGSAAVGLLCALRGGRDARLAAGLLAVAGGLALRFLVTRSGRRSAGTPEDTWEHAR
ncbi:MAG TPA: NrfD/PsrC family molybdoenzyme membrane anchor subunit [Longimicrobiales bacterium]|nr:NrfD/PsrC family molybdoenzyme membrane anchor subunit [Longimicrobiales bacterium]